MCPSCSYENRLLQARIYKARNKEKIAEYNRKYKSEHKEEISEYNKKYDKEHREEIQKRQSKQHKERRKTDPEFKLYSVVTNRLRKFYPSKGIGNIKNLVGCSGKNLVKWLEHNFTGNMSWENHGILWHIDHVICCEFFDMQKEEDRKTCFNWKNMRPLLAKKNIGRRFDVKDWLLHEIKVLHYVKSNQDDYDDIQYDWHLVTKFLKKFRNGSS